MSSEPTEHPETIQTAENSGPAQAVALGAKRKAELKALGHNLKPVVTIAGRGLADTVVAEVDRALHDHELIKVKIQSNDRGERAEISHELCALLGGQVVQMMGKIALIFRENPDTSTQKSNLMPGRK